MRHFICLALFVLMLSGNERATRAQDKALAFPPQLRIFAEYDENLATLDVRETYTALSKVTIGRVNAAGIEEEEVVKVPEVREQISKYLLAETTIRTVGGQQLDRKVAAKELKKGQPVILTTPFSKLPESYKLLFRDDAIVLEVKALGARPDLDGVPPEP